MHASVRLIQAGLGGLRRILKARVELIFARLCSRPTESAVVIAAWTTWSTQSAPRRKQAAVRWRGRRTGPAMIAVTITIAVRRRTGWTVMVSTTMIVLTKSRRRQIRARRQAALERRLARIDAGLVGRCLETGLEIGEALNRLLVIGHRVCCGDL
jgi:hypothetical protein